MAIQIRVQGYFTDGEININPAVVFTVDDDTSADVIGNKVQAANDTFEELVVGLGINVRRATEDEVKAFQEDEKNGENEDLGGFSVYDDGTVKTDGVFADAADEPEDEPADDGYSDGYNAGIGEGYNDGYSDGYSDGQSECDCE